MLCELVIVAAAVLLLTPLQSQTQAQDRRAGGEFHGSLNIPPFQRYFQPPSPSRIGVVGVLRSRDSTPTRSAALS
jgi:hypothetical protein